MNKQLIERLRKGEVCICYPNNADRLNLVLQEAWPGCLIAKGNGTTYNASSITGSSWTSCYTAGEKVSLEAFFEEEFKYGEEVEVTNFPEGAWHKAKFLVYNEFRKDFNYVTVGNDGDTFAWSFCRKVNIATELTMEEIAQKFNIPVEQLKIKK